jgi:serine/threonine protein kinase
VPLPHRRAFYRLRQESSPNLKCVSDLTGEFPLSADSTKTGIIDNLQERSSGDERANEKWDTMHSFPDARYQWEREFARGGLGAVWLARDGNLDRQVAVKELLPSGVDSNSTRQQFLTEARITGLLEHPGIVPIYDVGIRDSGHPFYSMKLLQGATFEDAIAEFHKLDKNDPGRNGEYRRLLRVFVDVCLAMEFAHQHDVIHRDLKPQNVMVGEFGEAIVLDWGLAKVLDDDEDEGDEDKGR